MRPRARYALGLIVLAAAGAACESFGADPPPAIPSGTSDADAGDVVGAAAEDGGVDPTWYTFPSPDAGSPGPALLATACTDVLAFRRTQIVEIPIVDTPTAKRTSEVAATLYEAHDVAADEAMVWFAVLNTGGLFARPLSGGSAVLVKPGNIWNLAVDDDGVYIGDHDRNGRGAVWMINKR